MTPDETVTPSFQGKDIETEDYYAHVRLERILGQRVPAIAIDVFQHPTSAMSFGPGEATEPPIVHEDSDFFPITPEGVQAANDYLASYGFRQRIPPPRPR